MRFGPWKELHLIVSYYKLSWMTIGFRKPNLLAARLKVVEDMELTIVQLKKRLVHAFWTICLSVQYSFYLKERKKMSAKNQRGSWSIFSSVDKPGCNCFFASFLFALEGWQTIRLILHRLYIRSYLFMKVTE